MKVKMRFRATSGNVFVETIDDPEKVGRIIIPEQARNKDMPSIGIVFAMGGRLMTKKGVLVEPEFKVGDKVLFRKYSGTFCDIGDKHLVQIKIHDVQALLTDE
jgi:co-chaperonin GroES (HSP10)